MGDTRGEASYPSTMSVWFGFHLPAYTYPDTPPEQLFDSVVEQARAAEEAGFRLVTVMDHLYQIQGVGQVDEPMLEGWSVLAALARETTRVRLGTLVTGVTYRNPALLAKRPRRSMSISGGRAILGLGAAWNEVEHEGYGYEFPPVRERMDRLDEALTIIRAMFTEDRPSFARDATTGSSEALNVPRPIQPGGPPILVGGGGEQRTLRIAARYADMTHWFPLGLEMLKHKNEVLDGLLRGDRARPGNHRADDGRAGHRRRLGGRGEGERSERIPAERRPYVAVGTPEQVAEALRPYIDAGFTGFTFNNTIYRTPEQIDRIGDLLRLVAGEVPTPV